MKPRIFINIHYLEIGGAERALLGFLSALDPNKVDIDLFVNQHTGEFMPLIPDYVNLLPEIPEYTAIERPIKDIVREGHIGIALRRLWAKFKYRRYIKTVPRTERIHDISEYLIISQSVEPALPSLYHLGEYDLAISFLQPHNLVLNKILAKKKICWIHTDYSTVHVDKNRELPVWSKYDHISSISHECTNAFVQTFPGLKDRIILIENILSSNFIYNNAELPGNYTDMPRETGVTNILSIGRFCTPKHFEAIPFYCYEMERMGLNFKWYIIGYGDDTLIQQALDKYQMRHRMILLGKKTNPYPYIKACDIYAQPSIYEGKSVTVREAQILTKPVVITDYPTAKSQITHCVDGYIVPLNEDETVRGIVEFAQNTALQEKLVNYLKSHDYGNESEVEKIYSLL